MIINEQLDQLLQDLNIIGRWIDAWHRLRRIQGGDPNTPIHSVETRLLVPYYEAIAAYIPSVKNSLKENKKPKEFLMAAICSAFAPLHGATPVPGIREVSSLEHIETIVAAEIVNVRRKSIEQETPRIRYMTDGLQALLQATAEYISARETTMIRQASSGLLKLASEEFGILARKLSQSNIL
jgi:hypothetical protein